MTSIHTKLLILADDLTGALDSGVQLSRKGDKVLIRTDIHHVFENTDADVLVVDTETRHIPAEDAYRIVYDLVKGALAAGINRIYKKTDSGLRGNVGAELTAVLDATGEKRLAFVPAWPKMNRTTKNGIHYVNGVPLAESIFASDVIDPVTESSIDKLIHLQSDMEVTLHKDGQNEQGIVVYDCTSDEELTKICGELFTGDEKYQLAAGCAGLLEKYPTQAETCRTEKEEVKLGRELLVLSGSMNDVTRKQLENAERNGAYRVHVPMPKIISGTWTQAEIDQFTEDFLKQADTPVAVIDTMTDLGDISQCRNPAEAIACYMGRTAKSLIEHGMDKTFMIIGGDTLQGFIRELGITALEPVREMAPGIVLAKYRHNDKIHYLITKSGGFGTEDQLTEIQEKLQEG
ncbi:MAG: four-carbon acid sugar kinase family protein [Solobacterium sp.]|nr:four-carbon acid sugar kinase family protein [Solobacterium sp.]